MLSGLILKIRLSSHKKTNFFSTHNPILALCRLTLHSRSFKKCFRSGSGRIRISFRIRIRLYVHCTLHGRINKNIEKNKVNIFQVNLFHCFSNRKPQTFYNPIKIPLKQHFLSQRVVVRNGSSEKLVSCRKISFSRY